MAKSEKINRAGQPRVGWEFFGSELKRRREAAKLTQQELGNRVYCSGSYIGQFEVALRKPQSDLAERIDVELKTDGFFARMCRELINSSPYEDYFTGVAELQALATTICQYGAQLLPGLLQTEGYARAVFRAAKPFRSKDETEKLVQIRIGRSELLHRTVAPELWVILDEGVLHRQIGTRSDMAEQLSHLNELAQANQAILQVLPYSSGAHSLLEGNLMLMTFPDAPPVSYVEAPYTGRLLDDPASVAQCQAAYDHARAAALPPEVSLTMIQSAAEEYRNEP